MRWRTAKRTETLANGTKVVRQKIVAAPELEWRLQAAQVRALRAMPEYDVEFTIAGDFNAARRSPQEIVKAKASGLTAGEPDLRVYIRGGRLGLIENKGKLGRLSQEQKDRHALLARLGFDVVVVKAETEAEAASRAVDLVRAWLGKPANDNTNTAGVA